MLRFSDLKFLNGFCDHEILMEHLKINIMNNILQKYKSNYPIILIFLTFFIFVVIGFSILFYSPKVYIPDHIDIYLKKQPVILGFKTLAQREGPLSADKAHIQIKSSDGIWKIANISSSKKVLIKTRKHKSRYLRRWELESGDTIIINDKSFSVLNINSSSSITIKEEGTNRKVSWQNGYIKVFDEFLYKDARPLKWRIRKRIKWWLKNIFSSNSEKELSLFSIGGGVNTPDRWHVQGLPPKSAYITWYKNNFYLMQGKKQVQIKMFHMDKKQASNFSQIEFPIKTDNDKIEYIIIGKTYYDLSFFEDENKIRLKAFKNTNLWFYHENKPESTDRVKIKYKETNFIGAGTISILKFFKY